MIAATLMSACVAAAALADSPPPAAAPAQAPTPAPRAQSAAVPQPAPTAQQDSADRIIAVARDVSPEWAASLEQVRERNPAGFEQATGVLAKRLKSLAVLKDRKPQLYALRVEELRIQGEVTALSEQWRSASSTGRTEEASAIETTLRDRVGKMVDLNLRSRAMELAELDEVMRSMRGDLERDARGRDSTVADALEAYRRGEEPAIGRSPVNVPPPVVPPPVVAPGAAEPATSTAPPKAPASGAPAPKSPSAPAQTRPTAPAPAQGTP